MTTTRTEKGLSRSQPLGGWLGGDNAANLFRMDRSAYAIDVLQSPFWIHLSQQIRVVVNRLDVRALLQAIVKGCAAQPQTPRGLFGCKHSSFLHSRDILTRLSIPIDKSNVKTYNTN